MIPFQLIITAEIGFSPFKPYYIYVYIYLFIERRSSVNSNDIDIEFSIQLARVGTIIPRVWWALNEFGVSLETARLRN